MERAYSLLHMKRLFLLISLFFAFNLLITGDAFAIQISDLNDQIMRPENLPEYTDAYDATVEEKISFVMNKINVLVMYASGSIAVLMLIIGGILYITSLGNQDRMDKAKNLIKTVFVGLLCIILAYALVTNLISLFYMATV